MAKHLNIDMSVRADTSQAKQAMMELQKSLNDILATRTITVNDTSINNAKQAALDLKHHLEAATNVQTGKLDLSKFSASLNKSGQSLQGLYNNLSQIGPAGQSAFLALSKSIAKADASAITLGGKLNGLMVTLKNTAKWQLSSSLLHGFMGAIQGAYGYAQDLNKSLNNIRVVTGQNIDQMAKFAKEANNAAKALSTTTTEYTDASLIYYQQGLTDEQVKERTDATIKLANISRQSAEEVSSQMTSIWNNFDDGSKSLEYYEDVITALGASTASSSQEIAEGLSKFAAVADTVGLSYDKAAAAVATVVAETRQSADTVGTAFKTMFARVEGLKLGDTLEDGVDLNKYSKALNTVGVSILDTSGQLKEMDDILDELGEKWASIDKTQQVALAQTVAGVRQYTQFVALMDNYDKVQKNQGIAENSEGTVNKQAEIYAESWEAARDRVTAAAEEIYDQLLNDEAFIDILNGVEKFLGFISNIIDGLGGLKGILLLIGSILMQQYAKEVPVFMQKVIQDIQVLTGAAEKNRQTMVSTADSIVQKMQSSNISKQFEGQLVGMQKVSAMYKELAEKRKFLSSAEIEAYEQKIKDVEMYGKLAEAIGKEIDQLKQKAKEERSQAQSELRDNGFSRTQNSSVLTQEQKQRVFATDEEASKNNLLLEENRKLQEQKEKELRDAENAVDMAFFHSSGNSEEDNTRFKNAQKNLQRVQGEVDKLKNSEEELLKKQKQLTATFSGSDLLSGFEKAAKTAGKMQGILDTTVSKTELWNKELKEIGNDSTGLKDIKNQIVEYINKMKEAGIDTSEVDQILDNMGDDLDASQIKEVIDILSGYNVNNESFMAAEEQVRKYKDALESLGVSKTTLDDLEESYRSGEITLEQYNAALQELDRQQSLNISHTMQVSEMFTQLGSAVMQVSMAINALKNLGNIWSNEDLSTGEKILQTMTTLGTLIPIITTLMNQEKIAQMGITAARILGITSINGETVAHLASIPAKEAAGAAGWAALGPALLFVAIAAAVVAAIGLIVYGLVQLANAESDEEKAARLANEELERSKKAADEAKQAYEDLKSKISDYDSAIEALEKCTKGTREWRDAFQEVMTQVSELIAAYPQLLKYENLYNSDGTLNQDILQKALDDAERTSISASNAVLANTVTVDATNLAKNYSDLREEVRGAFGVDEYAVGKDANNLQTVSSADIAEQVMEAAIAESKNINFKDDRAIEDFVSKQLEQFDLYGSNLEVATTQITDELIAVSKNLKSLGEETDNLKTSMFNASNVMFDSYFADKNFKDTNEKIAYQQAYDEKLAEIKKQTDIGIAAAYSGQHSDDLNWDAGLNDRSSGFNDYTGKENKGTKVTNKYYTNQEWDATEFLKVVQDYEKASGHKVDYDNSEDWKGGNVVELRLTDADNVNMQEVKDVVQNYRMGQAMADIERQGDEYYKKMRNQPVDASEYFATRGNFDEVSYEELAKTVLDENGLVKGFEEAFGDDEDKIKQIVANKLGKDVEEVEEADIELVRGYYEKTAEMAAAELEEIPDYVKNHLGDDLLKNINLGSLENVGKMYTKILANSGEEGLSMLDSIVAAAGEDADEVLGALADMDLTSMDAEQVNAALADLGVGFQLTESQVYSLRNALISSSEVTLESAQETYKSISSILSKLKAEGDIIEDEDYQKLLMLNPAIESFFTTLTDGTHMLTGEVQDFKTAMQSATMNQFYQAQENAAEAALAYRNLSSEDIKRADSHSMVYYSGGQEVVAAGNDIYNQFKEQTDAYIKILADQGEAYSETVTELKAAEEAGTNLNEVAYKAAKAFEELGISEEDFSEKAQEASKKVEEIAEAIKETQYQNELANTGLDYETTENYANILMEVYEAQGLSKDAARELAIANQRLDRGLSDLNDNFEQWSSNLKNNKCNTAEYAQTISDLRKSFADLLNIADGNELSLDWIEKWANDAETMAKILDGDTEAIQRFKEAAFTEITTNVFSDMKDSLIDLQNQLNEAKSDIPDWLSNLQIQLENGKFSADNLRAAIENIGNAEIGSGAVLSQEYVDALNTMLAQGLLTEQQLNDIFATIGYKPKVTTKYVDQDTFIPEYETTEARFISGYSEEQIYAGTSNGKPVYEKRSVPVYTSRTSTKQTGGKYMTQKVPVTQIESADKATGNIEIVNAGVEHINPSYGSTTSGKDSGSGSSGSSSTPTTKAASHDHEVNRYSDEENALEGLSKQYERLGKAKDKAFGKNKINLIEQEIQALKQLKNASSDYLNAVAGDADRVVKAIQNGENIGNLIASGALGGTLTSDYNSLYGGGKQVEYTAKDEAGNEWLESRYYSLDDFNSVFGSNLQFNLDSFGNIQGRDSILNFLQDLKNNEADAYAVVANPTAESTNEYNLRNALIETVIDHIKQYEDSVDKFTEQTDDYLDRITELQNKNAELITAKMDLGVNLSQKTTQRLERALLVLGEDYYKDSDSMKEYFEINQRKMEKDAKLAEQYATTFEEVKRGLELYEQNPNDPNAITPEAAAQMFSDLEDGMDDLIQEEIDSIESTKDLFSTTLNYWGEKISSVMDQIKENQDVLNHYIKVAELTGKGEDYAYMEKLQQAHFSNAKKAYQEAVRQTHMADEMLENAKKEYEAYVADKNHSQEEKDAYYEEHVASAQKYRDERYQTQVELGEMMMESDNTKFEYSAKKYLQEFENAATGPWGSFDTWNQSMERQKSITDEVLTKTNQLYETNTLLRKLSQDMDKTDSQNAKLKLKNFANEIDYMKNQEQLTKTDLEIAKARYEVLKAEIDLENTRNSKSTVRLKRDSEGNYGYIYTADQDAINDAEQNLEDKHNALYNLLLNYTNEYAQKLIEIDQQFSTALLELYTKNFESEEERQIAVTELMRQWNDARALALQQYNGFIVQLDEVAATDRAEAWTTSYAQTIMDQQTWKTHAEDMNRKVSKSHADLERDWVNYRTREIGADEDVAQSLRNVLDRTEELKMSLNGQNGLISRMADTTRTAQQLSNAFYDQHNAIRKTISGYRDLADEMSNNYFRTVDLINTQIALNYAQQGATSVSWGNEGVYASFDDGGSAHNDAGSISTYTPPSSSNSNKYITGHSAWDWNDTKHWRWRNYSDGDSIKVDEGNHIWMNTGSSGGGYYGLKCSVCGATGQTNSPTGPYKTIKVFNFKSGGYTGTWSASGKTGLYTGSWNGSDIEENGKLAFLHQKELVLNADDTENILDAVKLIRQISQSIDLQVAARGASISSLGFSLSNPDNILQQDVTIHAEFPNVSDHNEIEEALANLVNRASQFAYRN